MFVITGGGSGLGKALAQALAVHDKSVLIVGRRQEVLKETASHSPLIDYLCADLATEQGIHAVCDYVHHMPKIDGLVNNAGVLDPIVTLRDMSLETWSHALATNLTAPFLLSQKLYPKLIDGRVLNVGSGAGYFAIKGWASYCVSKAALSMLTRCWQLESQEVAFASVMPGIVDTDMQRLARSDEQVMDESQIGFYKRLHNEHLLLKPEAVAEFLVWLLLAVDKDIFCAKEWDIYDQSHHSSWLKAPYQIPYWE